MKPISQQLDEIVVEIIQLPRGKTVDPAIYVNEILALIDTACVGAVIKELKQLDATASRTYTQKVTDSNGDVYVDDTHTYISRYELQERLATLKSAPKTNQEKSIDNE